MEVLFSCYLTKNDAKKARQELLVNTMKLQTLTQLDGLTHSRIELVDEPNLALGDSNGIFTVTSTSDVKIVKFMKERGCKEGDKLPNWAIVVDEEIS